MPSIYDLAFPDVPQTEEPKGKRAPNIYDLAFPDPTPPEEDKPGLWSAVPQGVGLLNLARKGVEVQTGVTTPSEYVEYAKERIQAQGEEYEPAKRFSERYAELPGEGLVDSVLSGIQAVLEEPRGAVYRMIEQLPYSVPGMATSMLGSRIGGMVGGAAGATIGGLVGLAGGSFTTEKGAFVLEDLAKTDSNPDNWETLLSDPEYMKGLQERSSMKGAPVAIVDAASMALQLRMLRNTMKGAGISTLRELSGKQALGLGLKGQAVDVPMEMVGEAGGQYGAYGTVEPKEVALEGLMAFGASMPEMAATAYTAARQGMAPPGQPQPMPQPGLPQPGQPTPQPVQPQPQPQPGQPQPGPTPTGPGTKVTAPLPTLPTADIDPAFNLDTIQITRTIQTDTGPAQVTRPAGQYYQETYDKMTRLSDFLRCLGS